MQMRKVENKWILVGLISGAALQFVPADGGAVSVPAVMGSFKGMLFGMSLAVLYLAGGVGSGDIKLLMVSGAYLGPKGLAMALPLMAVGAVFWGAVFFAADLFCFFAGMRKGGRFIENGKLPLSPAIFSGVLLLCLTGGE
jgi:Flp pilus assembly protein protease CpaA